MTDPLNPTNPGDPGDPAEPTPSTPDESYSWTSEGAAGGGTHGAGAGAGEDASGSSSASSAAGTATAILEQLREAVDDLAERATPTVREFSARAAELAATVVDRDRRGVGRRGRPWRSEGHTDGDDAIARRRWRIAVR